MSEGGGAERGFTLLELMIALALGLIVLTALYQFFIKQQKAFSVQDLVVEMQQNARGALALMTKEIRMAGYSYQESKIVIATSTTFTFEADVDNDGTTEKIEYTRDTSNRITREARNWIAATSTWGTSGGAQPVAENITSLTFTYDSGTVADIRKVTLSLTARTARSDPEYPNNNGYRTFSLSSDVTPLNLAY